MISRLIPRATMCTSEVEWARDLIDRSGAADAIDRAWDAQRGTGGRPPRGIRYTTLALLVGMVCLVRQQRPVTARSLMDWMLCWCTAEQQESLGLIIPDGALPIIDREGAVAEYRRFITWLSSRLSVLDSAPDLPSRKTTNAVKTAKLAQRTAAETEAAEEALRLADTIVNDIVAVSVVDALPDRYRGDIVIDESTFEVSQLPYGMGVKPEMKRPAVPTAKAYVRSGGVVSDPATTAASKVTKSGAGFGLTAIIRIGPPGRIRQMPRAITSVVIREPDSGSAAAVDLALGFHAANGFDPRTQTPAKPNERQPFATVDMGYNVKRPWADVMFKHGYSTLGRLPENWNFVHPAENPGSPTKGKDTGQAPGPIMIEGSFVCPAIGLARPRLGIETNDFNAEDTRAHDRKLKRRLPFLMGTNSRLQRARRPGRPRKGDDSQAGQSYKLSLVCPADQGRVRCPLKVASMQADSDEVPTAEPDWPAERYECCSRMHTTVTLTERQAREYQVIPRGSWEHAHTFEGFRSLNEQEFSMMKSPHITNVTSVNIGPRREPFLKLVLAIAVAVTNLHVADAFTPNTDDSYQERWRRVEGALGHPPTRIPPLT